MDGDLSGIKTTSPYTYLNPNTTQNIKSTDFYKTVKAIYDNSYNPNNISASERLTIAQYYAIAGYGAGYYLNIVKQVLAKANTTLDISALILSQTGIATQDAGVGCIQVKYANTVVRPQTYIRKIISVIEPSDDKPGWTPSIVQPNHPDYPSGHSTQAGATTEVLIHHFGDNFSFTDTSFVNFPAGQQFAARTHSSFTQLANEIGDSRVYGQIHYPQSCKEGLELGQKVAQNVLSTLKFLKE